MLIYRCQRCLTELGPVLPDEPVPHCPVHPDGPVEEIDNADPQPE